jgi:mono/diheme cytochrome c family protein
MKKAVFLIFAAFIISGLGMALSQATNQPAKEIPANVIEVFKKHCASCHTGQRPPKGLSLIPAKVASAINAPSTEMPELKIIDTSNPESSYLLKKIQGGGDIKGAKMPRGRHLADADAEILKAWILGFKK